MLILTLESTCDETAAALVTDSLDVKSSVVATQEPLHRQYRGVVPEIAARAHVERMLPVIDRALRKADARLEDIDAVAVATRPGLAGSLVVGLIAAKTLCVALGKPLIGINHLHAHIYACRIASGEDVFPCIGLIVSGGHTSLYHCASPTEFAVLGGTVDDAAGEAFDKVASMLDLGYPGGPAIGQASLDGDPGAYGFPRPMVKDAHSLDFSFSGLKTAVRYAITGKGKRDPAEVSLSARQVADLAASFQRAVVDCLVIKTVRAIQVSGLKALCVGGGVAANRLLRAELRQATEPLGVALHLAPFELCTDNAVMGAIAVERLRAGQADDLDLDIQPGLVRHGRRTT